MPHCDYCGAHTYLPFTCSYCGGNYCGKCRLPPNHRCANLGRWEGKPRPPYPTRGWGKSERYEGIKTRQYPETNHKEREPRKKVSIKIQNLLNLKNLTTLSVILIAVGLFSQQYLITQYAEIFEVVIIVGVLGFLVSYFIYSLKCWGANSRISAVIMITIPLLVYFFSISKIPESANVTIYVFIIFCIFAIISTIFLFLFNKIKLGIENCIFNTKRRYHHYFHLKISYSLIGIVVISVLLVNYGSSSVFSNNTATILQSLQHINAPPQTNSNAKIPPPTPTMQNPQIISTLQPKIEKNYETGRTSKTFAYVLRGKSAALNMNLYSGVSNEISSKEPLATCIRYDYDSRPCTSDETRQYLLNYLDEPDQKKYLDGLVNSIQSTSTNKDDQARIAISLVQQIPYDYNKFYRLSSSTSAGIEKMRYPYEVLYDNKGVCSEKSVLLAYLLRGLGYGVVLFEFPSENHMAVGIKSPDLYAFRNSGYAFIEAAAPSIPTDDQANYVGAGKLISTPNILAVSDGTSFNSIAEEYKDAKIFNQLQLLSKSSGGIIDENYYFAWMLLVQKYGLKTSKN